MYPYLWSLARRRQTYGIVVGMRRKTARNMVCKARYIEYRSRLLQHYTRYKRVQIPSNASCKLRVTTLTYSWNYTFFSWKENDECNVKEFLNNVTKIFFGQLNWTSFYVIFVQNDICDFKSNSTVTDLSRLPTRLQNLLKF